MDLVYELCPLQLLEVTKIRKVTLGRADWPAYSIWLIHLGIIIFHDPDIEKMCDKKYFIEIEHDVCKSRRESRVWDPEGSCWEENPAYFEAYMHASDV